MRASGKELARLDLGFRVSFASCIAERQAFRGEGHRSPVASMITRAM